MAKRIITISRQGYHRSMFGKMLSYLRRKDGLRMLFLVVILRENQ